MVEITAQTNPVTNDVPVDDEVSGLTVVNAITEYRLEADRARQDRMAKNKRNRAAMVGEQDWSHKVEGQSSEFIPKTASSLEQFSAFIKRGMVQFGDWFSVDMQEDAALSGDQIKEIMKSFLEFLPTGRNKHTTIAHVLSDAAKVGLLESLIVIKVHGGPTAKRIRRFENGKTTVATIKPWRLQIDLIPTEDYYPDPTGKGLYEIHRVERDLSDIVGNPIYDQQVVGRIVSDWQRQESEAQQRKRENKISSGSTPSFRKRVVLDEFWGDILDSNGKVVHSNVVATVANETYLIRKPTANPFWHDESPFVAGPLMRVPFSQWHRALYDQVVPINEAMNELFNLMLDGGLASVWGIKQLRTDWLEDPRQVSNGLPQGTTLLVNDSAPPDAEVIKKIAGGEIPPEAMAMYNLLDKEYNAAALTNDIKLGLLPTKQVKATEIVEASQSQAITMDAIVGDFEFYIELLLKKCWINIIQHIDKVEVSQIDKAAGRRVALTLSRMKPAERFAAFGDKCNFKVFGLSATLSRARDFQRLMGVLQAVSSSPILLQSFHRRYSEDRIIDQLFKMLNLNPERLQRSPEELMQKDQELAEAQQMQQAGLTGNNPGAQGEAGQQSDINQEAKPSAGI